MGCKVLEHWSQYWTWLVMNTLVGGGLSCGSPGAAHRGTSRDSVHRGSGEGICGCVYHCHPYPRLHIRDTVGGYGPCVYRIHHHPYTWFHTGNT